MGKTINVVVLAAGKGARMCSKKPKALHELAGKSLLQHVLDTAAALGSASIQVVIGYEAEQIKNAHDNEAVNFVLQSEQRGTAHAVHQALEYLDPEAIALVLYADVPLIKAETLRKLMEPVHDNSIAILGCEMANPEGLGRIIRNDKGQIEAIVEEKDATEKEKAIRETNTGIMAIPVAKLQDWLPRVKTNNVQGEYYLTDVVALAVAEGCDIFSDSCTDQMEVAGVNNRLQLAELERYYQAEQVKLLMLSGVTIADPERIDVRGSVDIAQDVEIDINVIFEGAVRIATDVKIGPNCVLKNCEIGEGTQILANTLIDDSVIGKRCSIGPFARIRPGTELSEQVKIGNFVEIKKSVIKRGSKVNHLSYIGDSELGEKVNVGAGTITCNFDGVNKYKTEIGNDVFIGSNAVLIAPVTVEAGAFIGAGSTITKNIGKQQLAIARGRQSNIEGWKRPKKT